MILKVFMGKQKEFKEIIIGLCFRKGLEIHEWHVEALPPNLNIILDLNFVQETNPNKLIHP